MPRTFALAAGPTALTDDAETSIGNITPPGSAQRLVGVWATQIGAATITTAEANTGVFRVASAGNPGFPPLTFPLAQISVLTSGVAAVPTLIYPVNVPISGNIAIETYITIDDTMTGALEGRVGIVGELA